MQVTVYLYHGLAPIEPKLFRCLDCNRGLFKYNTDQVMIANIMGGVDVFAPGAFYLETQCHSCKSMYKVLFQ